MATRSEFAMFMVRLAEAIPRFAPDVRQPHVVEAWYDHLGQLSTLELTQAYQAALAKFDSFPSIREVLGVLGRAPPSPEDKAREVAERIWGAISRFHSVVGTSATALARLRAIDDYLGPIGAHVVKVAGGWNQICELATNDNATTLKAQWREFAKVTALKGPAHLEAPPTWDVLPEPAREAIRALTSRTTP